MGALGGVEYSHMTMGPHSLIKKMGVWRELAVFAVAAVSIVVFVRLGKYMGQRLDMSPPLIATLLPIAPTAMTATVAYCVLTPDSNDVAVYTHSAFVEEEREKLGAYKPDMRRNPDWVFIEKEGKLVRLLEFTEGEKSGEEKGLVTVSQAEWNGLGDDGKIERFEATWKEQTNSEMPDEFKVFANQKLGAIAQYAVLHRFGNDWIVANSNDKAEEREVPDTALVYRQRAQGAIIEGHFEFTLQGNEEGERYLYARVEVNTCDGTTRVYVGPLRDKWKALDLYSG